MITKQRIVSGLVILAMLAAFFPVTLAQPAAAAQPKIRWHAPLDDLVAPTMTASLAVDVNSNTLADPGDTLEYSVSFVNVSTDNLSSLVFTENLDAQLSFVPGSLETTPLAMPDSYTAVGNMELTIDATNGVLGGAASGANGADVDPDGGVLTLTPATSATSQGGTYNLAADGSFTYTPPVGFSGTDTFTYTITDNEGDTDTGTVSILISAVVWFINVTADAGGNGTQTAPFNSIDNFNAIATDQANHIIYLAAGNYAGSFVLQNGQKLIGQGVDFATASGLSAPTGVTFPSSGTAPAITNTYDTVNSGHAIIVGANNTIAGLTVGNTFNYAISEIGTNVGTLTISGVTINGSGSLLNLTHGGTLNASFISLTSTSTLNRAIQLTGMGGSLTVQAGAGIETNLTNQTLGGISISNSVSGAEFNFGDTTISGSSVPMLLLANNTGSTFSFGDLDMTGTAGTQLINASGGGTLTVASGTLSTSNTNAITLSNLIIGAGGVVLTSVSTSGGSSTAIVLASLTGGRFEITGSGATDAGNTTRGRIMGFAGSGGSLINSTTTAVSISNVNLTSLILRNMQITNNSGSGLIVTGSSNLTLDNLLINGQAAGYGLSATSLNGLTILHSEIYNNATNSGLEFSDTWNVRLDNLSGNVSVTHSLFYQSQENIFGIQNTSGSLNLTINNCEFRDTTAGVPGNTGLLISGSGTAVVHARVSGSIFLRNYGRGVQYLLIDSADGSLLVNGSTFENNYVGIDLANQASSTAEFTISNNTLNTDGTTTEHTAINLILGAVSSLSTRLEGYITGNTIGDSGIANSGANDGRGINLASDGAGSLVAIVNNNTIWQIRASDAITAQAYSTSALHVGMTGNSASVNTGSIWAFDGLSLHARLGTNVCANLTGNIRFIGEPTAGLGIYARTSGGMLQLQGYGGTTNDVAAIQSFLQTRATTVTPAPFVSISGGGSILAGTCSLPSAGPISLSQPQAPLAQAEPTAPQPVDNPLAMLSSTKTRNSPDATAVEPARLNSPDAESITIQRLPAGKSITIRFQAVIGNPLSAETLSVSTQGSLEIASPAYSFLTDDPGMAGESDPTVTNLNVTSRCGVTAGNSYTFNPGGQTVSLTLTQQGDLECVSMTRTSGAIPNGTAAMTDGYYWEIEGLNSDTDPATGFEGSLTFPHTPGVGVEPSACFYTGGVGFGWDCAGTQSYDATTVTRQGLDHFSTWAIGYDAGPTAVSLRHAGAQTGPIAWMLIVAALASLAGLGLVWAARRRRLPAQRA